jgi:hypothetical protein
MASLLLAMRAQAPSRLVGSTNSNRRIACLGNLELRTSLSAGENRYLSQSQAVSSIFVDAPLQRVL